MAKNVFFFINDLCESRLISSRTSLKRWDVKKLSELCYLYFIGLRILLSTENAQKWAQQYCKKAGEPNDFKEWRSSGNDLYVMLHALSGDSDDDGQDVKYLDRLQISPSVIRYWLRHVAVHENVEESTHKLFLRLDNMFHIDNTSMKSMRRIVTEWDDVDPKERQDTLTKLIQLIHTRAPSNSELLSHLKDAKFTDLEESASTGATGAANVATAVGGLGAGFDPKGDWRSVYGKKKPLVIRREPAKQA